jgi:hypothetical protein
VLPGHMRIKVKAPFGEVIFEGDTAQEILNILEGIPPEFIGTISAVVSSKLTLPTKAQLEGIVEFSTEGPVITTQEKFTHYEAIGLVLYASDEKSSTAAHIDRLLQSSGVKAMVPARLNEMIKRGLVFKPDPVQPLYKLTTQGDKWVEEKVVPKLKGRV